MGFEINGQAMGIMPYSQQFRDVIKGVDHNGRPIYAAAKEAVLEFDNMSVAKYSQFSASAGASLTSIQLLNVDSGSYTVYNNAGIVFQITDRPKFEAGNVSKWSATITGITP